MDIEKIKNANTKYFGKEIIYYKKIESTQDEAKKIVEDNIKSGTIIITDNQIKGKGTKNRSWYSSKEKNITMTLIIYPDCTIEKLEGLTIKIAETLVSTIYELYNIKLNIKVPNDLMLNNKKIAGILTESSTYKNIVKHIIIGIGFNVNETNFSEHTIEIATSLKKEYEHDFQREEIIIKFIEKLEKELIK